MRTSANATINRATSSEQIVAYSEAVKIDPYLYPARAGLAEIFLSRGNLAEAAEQYRVLVNGPHPEAEAVFSLARILIMMQLREDKEKRDWEPVDKVLDQIQHEGSLTPDIAVLKAEVLLAKDLPSEAEEFLEAMLREVPQERPAMAGLDQSGHVSGRQRIGSRTKRRRSGSRPRTISIRPNRSWAISPILREKRGQLRRPPQGSPGDRGAEEVGRKPGQDDRFRKNASLGQSRHLERASQQSWIWLAPTAVSSPTRNRRISASGIFSAI